MLSRTLLFCVLGWAALPTVGAGADGSFTATLTPEQQTQAGLHKLTAPERAALDFLVAQREAAGVTAATRVDLPAGERDGPARPAPRLRLTATLLDPFRGWDGRTRFRLDNGQVWEQAAPDRYITKERDAVDVVVFQAPSGYFRLRILDDEGAWVTVRRVR